MTQTQIDYQKMSETARHNLQMERIGEVEAQASDLQARMKELSTRLEVGDKWLWQRLTDSAKVDNDRWRTDAGLIGDMVKAFGGIAGSTMRLIG